MGCVSYPIEGDNRNIKSDKDLTGNKVGYLQLRIKSIFLHTLMRGLEKASDIALRFQVSNQFQEFNLDEICTTLGK